MKRITTAYTYAVEPPILLMASPITCTHLEEYAHNINFQYHH